MGLKTAEILKIREEVKYAKDPLYFFHDDPDGVASFLQFYRAIREGKGIIVKTRPIIDQKFLRKVEEYRPDKIFVLDIAMMEQEFVDEANVPIIWIDHHGAMDLKGVQYYNPRTSDATNNVPVSTLAYQILEQDLWIAMVGAVGDWSLPPFTDAFKKQYPDLLPEGIARPEDALFNSRLGELVRIFSFVLKGTTSDAMKYVKVLTRIDSPYEILDQTSSQGRYIYRRFKEIDGNYRSLLADIEKNVGSDRMIVYTYPESKMSFTGDVTNELLYKYPEKTIVVGRIKGGEVKCSIRSPADIMINEKLAAAIQGLDAYGGGHEHACGAVIKQEDFESFIANLKKEIG